MICLVTDRRRLVTGGAGPDASVACLVAQVRYAVEAGALPQSPELRFVGNPASLQEIATEGFQH